MVTYDGKHFHAERRMGLVSDTFTKTSILGRLKGNSAIGHKLDIRQLEVHY